MLYLQVKSLKLCQHATLLERLDCEGIQKLMENGFTLQEAMNLLENRKNRIVFQSIRNSLENGEGISKAFHKCCPRVYRHYFEGFILYLPFLKSLTLSMRTVEAEEQQKKQLEKGLMYPCGMLFATVAGMIVFNELCIPPLVSMMKGFQVSMGGFQNFHQIVRIVSVIVTVFLILSAGILIWFNQEANLVNGYRIARKILPNSFLIQYASMDFIRFYLECIKMGIHTRECLQIIQSIDHKPLIGFLAHEMEHELMNGEKFETAAESPYLDEALSRFMKIAVYSSDMERMLDGYLLMCRDRIQRQCRKMTRIIQLLSYSSIGLILILVYQLLMLPLMVMAKM